MVKENSRTAGGTAGDGPGFREVADRLRADIKAGKYAPGEKLPAAGVIAEPLKVGKTVVYRAFAALQAEGLVDVRPGSGAFVRSWAPILRDANQRLSGRQWGEGLSIWAADIGDRELKVDVTLSVATDVPADVRGMLDVARYRVRRRVFTVDGERVQLATSYLDADATADTAIENVNTGKGGTFARLQEAGLGPTRFREDIRTRTPSTAEAEVLRIGANRPVYEILRENATAEGQVVEVTHMVLVADAYVLRYHVNS